MIEILLRSKKKCYHLQKNMTGNSKIIHCGIVSNVPPSNESHLDECTFCAVDLLTRSQLVLRPIIAMWCRLLCF